MLFCLISLHYVNGINKVIMMMMMIVVVLVLELMVLTFGIRRRFHAGVTLQFACQH